MLSLHFDMNFEKAEAYILGRFRMELQATLYYHGIHHTLDVYGTVNRMIAEEGIAEADALLLRTATLFHDSGFLTSYENHELEGIEIVKSVLPGFGYSDEQIEAICAMIMATQI